MPAIDDARRIEGRPQQPHELVPQKGDVRSPSRPPSAVCGAQRSNGAAARLAIFRDVRSQDGPPSSTQIVSRHGSSEKAESRLVQDPNQEPVLPVVQLLIIAIIAFLCVTMLVLWVF